MSGVRVCGCVMCDGKYGGVESSGVCDVVRKRMASKSCGVCVFVSLGVVDLLYCHSLSERRPRELISRRRKVPLNNC